MQSVIMDNVLALKSIMETHTLVVDQNVLLITIALEKKLAFAINVQTHVKIRVEKMLYVMFTIMYQCVGVQKERKEMHLSDVLHYYKVHFFLRSIL